MHTELTDFHVTNGWIEMWAIAGIIFLAAKWLTLRAAVKAGANPSRAREFAYVCLWPGMNAKAFCGSTTAEKPPRAMEWLVAVLNVLLGAASVLLWVPLLLPRHPMIAGWIAMIGLSLFLHFGVLAILSNVWRKAGVEAKPIMHAPLASNSLANLWSRRWNRAFTDFAHIFVYTPAARRVGPMFAVFAVFAFSGLVHELVISVPAGGGFGLPTAYFLIQAAGICLERTGAGHAVGLGHGVVGWLFTITVAAGPAYWLFHPLFVHNVVLPMLKTIGAT